MGAIIKKTINKAPLEETEERKEARKDVKNKRWHRQEKQKRVTAHKEDEPAGTVSDQSSDQENMTVPTPAGEQRTIGGNVKDIF